MSAGRFLRGKYTADAGTVHPIRIQEETVFAQNPQPTEALTPNAVSARVGGGNNRLGLKARSISLVWQGEPPEGYKEEASIRIPILTKASYDAIALNSTLTYLGKTAVVVGKSPERLR